MPVIFLYKDENYNITINIYKCVEKLDTMDSFLNLTRLLYTIGEQGK